MLVNEVADVLRVSREKVIDLCNDGTLAHVRLGHRTIRIPADAVDRLLG
jgi:excisionase family DNA binding protein